MERELELQLVDGLRRRDPAAFEAVYDAFHGRIFGFLARLSNNRDVAEDLVEETWLRLVAHATRLRPDTSLGAWLFTVARNLHASYCRSRLLEDAASLDTLGLWPAASPSPSPVEVAEASEMATRIAAALSAMPLMYREALLLAVEGLRPAEAAVICGITPEAMRQRLSRARGQLDRRLAETAGPRLSAFKEIAT
jgi:RNA polymerase sigma-70 factor (ECF subfamily)